MIQRTMRGGSIVGFVAACLVGAVLLVGSVYAVRHLDWFQSGVVTNDSSSGTATSDPSKTTTKQPTKQPSDTSKQKETTPTSSSSKTAPSTTVAPSSNQSSTSTGNTDGSSTAPQSSAQAATPAALPQTGPSDILVSLASIGCLTAASVAYIRSRRSIQSL